MKKLKLLIVIALAIFMSSCGNRDKISEVRLIPVKSGAEFQYIDRDGRIIINPQFRQATVFREGLALIQTSGDEPKWGFINEEGIYVINAQYIRATVFSEGIAWVISENAAPSAIDKKGDSKFTLQNAKNVKLFKEGLAAYSIIDEDGYEKWGFVDKNGQVVINAQFYGVSSFSEGLCAVRNSERKWGFIDKEGKIIINPQFDGAQDFYKGRCIVVSGYRTGVIDKDGKYLINPQFDKMMYDGSNFLIEQDDRIGWCDKDGKIIINPQFPEALPFNNHKLAPVLSGKQWGYIDNTGKIIINPQFDFALPFNGQLALVVSSNKLGFINDEGRFVINPQFDNISDDFSEFIIAGKSRYESLASDLKPPIERIAENYLRHVAKQEWKQAKALGTEDTQLMIDMISSFGDGNGKEVKIEDMKCTVDGITAVCVFRSNGEPDKLNMLKVDGTWLVDQKKEMGDDMWEDDDDMWDDEDWDFD